MTFSTKRLNTNVLLVTGMFVNLFFLAYLLSPRFCHKFVGYLEEEAVKTYTYCLKVTETVLICFVRLVTTFLTIIYRL